MAQTTPQREEILAAILALCKNITTDGQAYRTKPTSFWRRVVDLDDLDPTQFPALMVVGGDEAPGAEGGYHGQSVVRRFTVLIYGAVLWNKVDDETASQKLEKLQRDVEEAVIEADPQLGFTDGSIVNTYEGNIATDGGLLEPHGMFQLEALVDYYRLEVNR